MCAAAQNIPQASCCWRVLPQEVVFHVGGGDQFPTPPVLPTKQSPGKDGEWGGWGWPESQVLASKSKLVSPMELQSGFDFLLPSPSALPHKPSSMDSIPPWEAAGPPLKPSNSQRQLKLQERERGGGEVTPYLEAEERNPGRTEGERRGNRVN